MVYSINASLYYSTISTLLDHPFFQSISYLVRVKKPNFVGLLYIRKKNKNFNRNYGYLYFKYS